MTPEFPQKRSGRKRRKPLKIGDENASDEDEQVAPPLSHSSSTQPAAALLQPIIEEKVIKKKRGRKPGQGPISSFFQMIYSFFLLVGRKLKQKISHEELDDPHPSYSVSLLPVVDDDVIQEEEISSYLDLEGAIQKGFQEISKIPFHHDPSVTKSIGYLCKVFWDQDNVWYTGRVILYDPIKSLHLIYFDVDGTAEWINTSANSDDYVLLADELVLFGSWPALKYSGSLKGFHYIRPKNERTSGEINSSSHLFLTSTDTYVEYFPHAKSITTYKHAFAKLHELKPLTGLSALKSRKKIRIAAEHAQSELSQIYRIKQVR